MPAAARASSRSSILLFGPAIAWLVIALVGLVWTRLDAGAWATLDRHGDPTAGSLRCRSCHPDEYDSWYRSWHRTMTQQPAQAARGPLAVGHPSPAAIDLSVLDADADGRGRAGQAGVLAPFAGEQLDYGGFRATMERSPAGGPRILVERLDPETDAVVGPPVLDAEVALTVGSHRYQQYVAYLDRGGGRGELWRLPLAWHRAEARWIHMNGAFVEPEGEPGSLDDYSRHLSRWNDNCIFCHNTAAVPGRDAGEAAGFVSAVGELGIACEACHGPAAAHLRRHRRNPFRRLLADRGRGDDGSIADPGALGPARASDICGRCHGQRIARDIAEVMAAGDGFVAGDELAEVSRPIFATTTLAGDPRLASGQPFAARFWPDGSPRLSAYEFQGLLLSPCWDEGEGLGCGHCHDMHGDDPDGQLRAGRAGPRACLGCHDPLALGGSEDLGGHGGHGGHGDAIDCLDCHMPTTTYGLLEGMISHRITSPDPGAWVGRGDQPDACTQCHVERSRSWAAASMAALGLSGTAAGEASGDEALASRVVLDLLGGDGIQRNLAAHALAAADATGSLDDRMAWIAEGLEDEYPSVRWFAWRGLRQLAARLATTDPRRRALLDALARYDYIGPIAARVELVSHIRAQLGPAPLADHPAVRERLFAERHASAIWIGE